MNIVFNNLRIYTQTPKFSYCLINIDQSKIVNQYYYITIAVWPFLIHEITYIHSQIISKSIESVVHPRQIDGIN